MLARIRTAAVRASMRLTIFGTGYVGLVTGACLAETGNDVVCVDVDADRIASLERGELPIYEPGLKTLVDGARKRRRLRFTTDVSKGVDHGLFQFIAVGTPADEDGAADLQHVLAAARSIGAHLSEYRIVVVKSTVPVGTADRVKAEIQAVLDERDVTAEFDVVSNPEFLKEGAAINDFMKPDRILIGTGNPRTAELLKALYDPFNRNHDRVMIMDVRSAELTKYAAKRDAGHPNQPHERTGQCRRAPRRRYRERACRHRIGSADRLRLHLPGLRLRRIVFPQGCPGPGRVRRIGRVPF